VFVSPLGLFAMGRCIDFLYVSRLKRGKTIVRTVTVTIDGAIKAALVPIDVIAITSTCSYVYTDNATQIYFTLRPMSHRRRGIYDSKVYVEETKYMYLPFFLSKRIFRKKIFIQSTLASSMIVSYLSANIPNLNYRFLLAMLTHVCSHN